MRTWKNPGFENLFAVTSLALILLRPSTLLWALLAGAVVVFYMRAIRPLRVVIARPYLWQEVLGETRSAAGAWRRRRAISLTFHVGVVILLSLAAAEPCLRRPRTVVLVVDNSPSMEAVEQGSDRLARAKRLAVECLETLEPGEFAAVVTTAGRPVVVCAAESDFQRVADAIGRIRTANLPSRVVEAADVASGLAATGTETEVHVFSDGCFDGAENTDLGSRVTIHPVGSAAENAGITRLAVRRYPEDARRFQLIAEVTNPSDTALATSLQVILGGKPIHQTECKVDAGATATVMAELESEAGGPVEAAIGGEDAVASDNRLATSLPDGARGGEAATAPWPESRVAGQQACRTQSPEAWCGEPQLAGRPGMMPLWRWLVLAAIVLLAMEWGLYQRRWME